MTLWSVPWTSACCSSGAFGGTSHGQGSSSGSEDDVQRVLAQIRSAGARAGLAINPGTPLTALDWILDDIDLLLVMTVNPGFGGQEYLPAMTDKIREARAILKRHDRPIELQVDGGIEPETAPIVVGAGAETLVAGTSVFGHPNGAVEGIRALHAAVAGAS